MPKLHNSFPHIKNKKQKTNVKHTKKPQHTQEKLAADCSTPRSHN